MLLEKKVYRAGRDRPRKGEWRRGRGAQRTASLLKTRGGGLEWPSVRGGVTEEKGERLCRKKV